MDKDMAQEVVDILTSNIDTLWVIDCAILVFIMQAGFMCMETGLSSQNLKLSDDLTLISIGK